MDGHDPNCTHHHDRFVDEAQVEIATVGFFQELGYGYPPDLQDEATKIVLAQAELLCADLTP